MQKDFFAHKAASYEKNKKRVENVNNIAKVITKNLNLNKAMHVLDFGSGTGLLLERIAPYVGKITAIDVSPAMNKQLEEKQLTCELEILNIDLTKTTISQNFAGIISSMTLHHIEDVPAMFDTFYNLLDADGFIAIADLDKEDGSFHTEDTGVFHHGFEHEPLLEIAQQAGFTDAQIIPVSVIEKDHGNFPIFLLMARKSSLSS